MTEDKKPDLNFDDWDSIPLDPAADDWDDPSAAAPYPPPAYPAVEPAADQPSDPEPEIVIDFDIPEPLDSFADQGDEADGPDDADGPDEAAAQTDFGSVLSGFESVGLPPDDTFGPFAPVADSAEIFDPFEQIDAGGSPAELEIAAPPAPPEPPADLPAASSPASEEPEEPEEDYDVHLGAGDIDDAFAAIEGPPAPPPEMLEPDLNFDELTTKKVELDIDGIFLDSAAEEAPAPPEPEPVPLAPEEPAPEDEPPPEPVRKKIPKAKLLLIAVPALVVLLGLVFGAYKIFFSSEEETPAAREAIIDPRVQPRDPEPGEMTLGAFYIGFPGNQGDTLVEMTVVLHYNDFPDQAVIEERLATVRDLIFRATQGKGSQVISDGEMQKALREELAANINLVLGREAVSYVQITQIRILH